MTMVLLNANTADDLSTKKQLRGIFLIVPRKLKRKISGKEWKENQFDDNSLCF